MPITLTIDEIINTVLRSNLKDKGVTTVFMEDKLTREKTSLEPYRFMQKQLGQEKINFFSCQGIKNLMAVFNRRNELKDIPILFLRDRDFFIYKEIPSEFKELIFTNGYSIENDVCNHTGFEDLFLQNEREKFLLAKANFITWYSSQVHLQLNNGNSNYDFTPHKVLSSDYMIKSEHQNSSEIIEASKALRDEILEEYAIKLRGHSLFALIILFTDTVGRVNRINYEGLLKYCIYERSCPQLMKLISDIEQRHLELWNYPSMT